MLKDIYFSKKILGNSFSSSSEKPSAIKIGSAEMMTFRDPRPRFPPGPRWHLAYTTLRFSCSLTRRASRTRRGYRWPTSELISYSSKAAAFTVDHPVAATSITTITFHHYHHHHRQQQLQQYKNNTDTTNQHNLHSTVHSIVCKRSILFAFRSLSVHLYLKER